jgi:hypothetical protein
MVAALTREGDPDRQAGRAADQKAGRESRSRR